MGLHLHGATLSSFWPIIHCITLFRQLFYSFCNLLLPDTLLLPLLHCRVYLFHALLILDREHGFDDKVWFGSVCQSEVVGAKEDFGKDEGLKVGLRDYKELALMWKLGEYEVYIQMESPMSSKGEPYHPHQNLVDHLRKI